jgi:hypothetical protein
VAADTRASVIQGRINPRNHPHGLVVNDVYPDPGKAWIPWMVNS